MAQWHTVVCVLVVALLQVHGGTAQQRIIGGKRTENLKHPYNVSIRSKISETSAYLHQCAGVIYTARVVITAAQCVKALPAQGPIMIVAGANTRTGGDGYMYVARKWLAHELYDSIIVDYDIGLIWIEQEFDFTTSRVAPLALRTLRPAVGRLGTVSGWGYTEEYGSSAYYLQEVQVPFVSIADCKAIYGANDVTERMICAGNLLQGGKDACLGDTGGALVFDSQLVGLVSWGRGCARPGYPTVYTWVSSLKSWIDQQINATAYNK